MNIERESIHRGPEGGRTLELYEQELDRDFGELIGKRVLDIGSGSEVKFANGLKRRGISMDVVSISPAYAHEGDRSRVLPHMEGSVLAARAQSLPFADDTFDAAISLHVAEHLDESSLLALLRESLRVVKPGATVDVTPLYDCSFVPNRMIPDLQDKITNAFIEWRRPRSPFDIKRLTDPSTGYKEEVDVYIVTMRKRS